MPPERITKTMTLPPEPHVEPSTSKKPAAPTYLRFMVAELDSFLESYLSKGLDLASVRSKKNDQPQ